MLKQKMLITKRGALEKKLTELRNKKKQLRATEDELQAQIDELQDVTPEIEAQVEDLERQQTETDDAIAEILDQIDEVKEELASIDDGFAEIDDNMEDARSRRSAGSAPRLQRSAASRSFRCRSRCFETRADMEAFYAQREMKDFISKVRAMAIASARPGGRRSVSGADLGIPDVLLGLIRDNLGEYSKLIRHVRLREVNGTARQNVTGQVPEGVWTEMCASLNELSFGFTQIEMDGYKVGGYVTICRAVLADSTDINLGEEIVENLLRAVGKALDKAIIFGKGPNSKMPVGFATRLAETEQPAYWGANQGVWTDLHSSHVLTLNLSAATGVQFFQPMILALGKADPAYSDGGTVWCMNRTTHMAIKAAGLAFTDAGTLVSGINGSMPVEGGEIVELDFLPDYWVGGGFLDLYLMTEREGATWARSDDVRFFEDEAAFKATARYDGKPIRGEGFVVLSFNNSAPVTAQDFATDYANKAMNVLICTAAQGGTSGKTVVTVTGAVADAPVLKYAVRYGGSIAVGDAAPADFADLTSGSTAITAAAGAPITVVELDAAGRVISAGSVLSVPKA